MKHQTSSGGGRCTKSLRIPSQYVVSSVSLLSFILLCHSSGLFYFLEDLNIHFNFTLISPLFNQIPERKYVFLICIGLIAFLAKSLRFSRPSRTTSSDLNDQVAKIISDAGEKPDYKTEAPAVHKEAATASSTIAGPDQESVAATEKQGNRPAPANTEETGTTEGAVALIPETEQGTVALIPETEQGTVALIPETEQGTVALVPETEEIREEDESWSTTEETGSTEDGSLSSTEETAEDEGNEAVPYVSTEDLKTKFDEFIKKMKETSRIEALRQLIPIPVKRRILKV